MIVDARLEEIFELVNKELKSIGRAAKLPGGAVLSGGGAHMPGIAEYARQALQISARVGHTAEFAGVSEKVAEPAWDTAVGLMLIDLEGATFHHGGHDNTNLSGKKAFELHKVTSKITDLIGKFRS